MASIHVHLVHRDDTQTYVLFDVTCADHSILLRNERSNLFTNSAEDLIVYFWLQCWQKYDTDLEHKKRRRGKGFFQSKDSFRLSPYTFFFWLVMAGGCRLG